MKKILSIFITILFFIDCYSAYAQNTHSATLVRASSQYFTAANSASLSITGDLTVEMWVKFATVPAGANETRVFAGDGDVSGASHGPWFFLWKRVSSVNKLSVYVNSGSVQSTVEVNWTPIVSTWYHVAFTYSTAGKIKFYVDGVQQGADQTVSPTSLVDAVEVWHFGSYFVSGYFDHFFDGEIDDIRAWSVVRTVTEINDNKCVIINSASNLRGSWHLDNGLTDASGNNNTLTNVNSATITTSVPPCATAPILTSPTATSITSTGATLGANITSNGGASITARGTCWGTSANPTTNCVAEGGTVTGIFTQARTGLQAGTIIYYRGYATNSVGTSYSADGTFTTLNIPTVTTQAITNIAATTATGNGNVSADGGTTITERGVCWNTSATPTTANSKATSTGTTGAFTASMTGLSIGSLYYVRAYAINSVGVSYGNDVTFTTLNIPTVTTPTAISITTNSATLGANITSDGGAAITARGTCWGTSANPSTNCIAEGGTATGVFTKPRTGLPAGTLIYYRGYATNNVGTGYSADGTFTTVTPATVNWNNSNVQEITLDANRSFSFTNGKSGGLYTLIIKQDGTGGWTVTWSSNIKWAGGITPILSTTANAVDLIRFVFDGTNFLGNGITLDIK
ncbi:MAG: LamG domain-containing protein [Bacteroidetes bacterium]|nr:LamG domain-containing protein [Bacteroidota bacterium]